MAELSSERRFVATRRRTAAPLRLSDDRADLVMLLIAAACILITVVGAWRGWW